VGQYAFIVLDIVAAWMGENYLATLPTVVYGAVLFLSAIAYYILQKIIIQSQGKDSVLAKAIGNDLKGKASPACYLLAILLAFLHPWIADVIYALVACIWLIPDRRIEKAVTL
jgi:uncharacterized membrane protein